jgi:hypothetical protein
VKLICSSLLNAWRTTIWPTCQHLIGQYIVAPVRGMIDIAKGLLLAVPELADGLMRNLSPDARCRVQQGINLIVRGWSAVQVPLVVVVLVIAFGWDGLVLAISIGSVMPA